MLESERGSPPDEASIEPSTDPSLRGRREFFKRAAVAGGAVAVSASAAVVVAEPTRSQSAQSDAAPDKVRGYRESEHVSTYYRLARL